MSWLSKGIKKLKKVAKKAAPVLVPALAVHKLAGSIEKKAGKLPFGNVIKAGIAGADPLSATRPAKMFRGNVKALKQGAPLIPLAVGAAGVSGVLASAVNQGAGFLSSGGDAGGYGPTPIVEGGEAAGSAAPASPSPVVIGAVAVGVVLLVVLLRRK